METKMIRFTKPPSSNIVDKQDFLERVKSIFQFYEDALVKTLGAYGSPTIISQYPAIHVTKDGFTVCRNIELDGREGELIDQTISLLIMDICSRLNYSVGDGTTTAIIAANELFRCISELIGRMEKKNTRPKVLIETLHKIKDLVIEKLEARKTLVTPENMNDVIRKIVHVSSNSDEKITEMITEAYEKLKFPEIMCVESEDNKTYLEIVNGFDAKVLLGDKIYINNDEQTARAKNCDVIMFDHKVTLDAYTTIIRPLCMFIRKLGRHLICIAPAYDGTLKDAVIKRELRAEFEETQDICLVVAAVQTSTEFLKKTYADLATVLGTTLIDKVLEKDLVEKIEKDGPNNIPNIINFNDRKIPGINVIVPDPNDPEKNMVIVSQKKVYVEERLKSCIFTLGFTEEAEMGMTHSIFHNTFYNKMLYEKSIQDAEHDVEITIQKYTALGTYSREIYDAQKRLASLNMQMAKIYVGGDSEMSKNLLRDSVEDSIRAAESAFRNGYVQGCNLSLILSILDVLTECEDGTFEHEIGLALLQAFESVYYKVLENAFSDHICKKRNRTDFVKKFNEAYGIQIKDNGEMADDGDDIFDMLLLIITKSICTEKVFNLETMEFEEDTIINSVKTDIEVLTATIDMLSLMVVGNQVVMASYNHMKRV